jgi:hypothetical protein
MIKDNVTDEYLAGLLIKFNLADNPHTHKTHHITHVHGYEAIFHCGICKQMKQDGILARVRTGRGDKVSRYSYFICSECMQKAASGRDP